MKKTAKSSNSIVYLLKSEKFYKIGVTTSTVEKRIKTLQTGNPHKIKYIHHERVSCDKTMNHIEKMLHKEYKHRHVNGEWFLLNNDEVNQVILKLKVFKEPAYLKYYKELKYSIYRSKGLLKKRKNKNAIDSETKIKKDAQNKLIEFLLNPDIFITKLKIDNDIKKI
jgi:hypothetical protein